jgi:hypothetical protein
MTRTTLKLILAGALLVMASFMPQGAQASGTCCTNCYNRWLSTCYNSCNSDPDPAACQSRCDSNYESCAIGCSRYGQSCPF